YMDEASLCDRVALIQEGKILSTDTPAGVISAFGKPLLAVKSPRMLHLLNMLRSFDMVADVYPFGEYHHVVMKREGEEKMLEAGLKEIEKDITIMPVVPHIEDCFMALMKN
ncbi:MAG TPA: ABC transporter ATP-binding protein, partial [Flavitalea sp.]|nr:ABC transporter ATP-binding protein [Flavitalea sp.]